MEKSCIWNFNYVENEKRLPESWEEFCEMFPVKDKEYFITPSSSIVNAVSRKESIERFVDEDSNILPDRATAEAILALCQLIQLRNAYNGDWVPDFTDKDEEKFVIEFYKHEPRTSFRRNIPDFLYFKTEELRDEFLRCFRPLIEKLKPLYGIKEGGEE